MLRGELAGAARALIAALCALCATIPAASAAESNYTSVIPDVPFSGIFPLLSGGMEELLRAAADTCEALPLEVLFSQKWLPELARAEVVEYRRDGGERRVAVARAAGGEARVLYVPGWGNAPGDESTAAVVRALLAHAPVALVLDTRRAFGRGYVAAAARVTALSHLLYSFLERLHKQGEELSSVHLVGFSLGAHVVGGAGRLARARLGRVVGRITALDPAKPCFGSGSRRLARPDAAFVHVLHTSAGVLGLEPPLGHADVYVDGVHSAGGARGAGGGPEWRHALAWRLFAASAAGAGLRARRCRSWDELLAARCSGADAHVGIACSNSTRGLFLYKSKMNIKREEPRLRVFNPFGFLTRWIN